MTDSFPSEDLAVKYHLSLPLRIRDYLNARGILDRQFEEHLLGWNGERITIPIRNRDGKITFFKLAKDPEDKRPGSKMITTAGSSVELYGWEWLHIKPARLVICEGEFDRLVLERYGIPAVTSTGGAATFRSEWVAEFSRIAEVYVCFDRDDAGRRGAVRVAQMIPHAKIAELPEEVGDGGDVTDFFIRLKRDKEDFLCLLRRARPAPEPAAPPRLRREPRDLSSSEGEVAHLKSQIAIEDIVRRYLPLRHKGRYFTGRCPFHEDRVPSFTVYPETQSFFCYGCQAHGDVIGFLMQIERLTFPEALDALRRVTS